MPNARRPRAWYWCPDDVNEETTTPDLEGVLAHFAVQGRLVQSRTQPGGHIHDSWRVDLEHDGTRTPYLLQTMNTHVFWQPLAVMHNVTAVTAHVRRHLAAEGVADVDRRVLTLVSTRQGSSCLADEATGHWRLFRFIDDTISRVTVDSAAQAASVGAAYGAFQRCLADYDGPPLAVTIPHFHDTFRRYSALCASAHADGHERLADCHDALEFAQARRELSDVLPDLQSRGKLPERIVHNDAKPSNVLFDAVTDEGLAVIDLDTVMPGSALHDFGDMVRSCTSTAGEDRTATEVDVDLDLFRGLVEGYLAEAGDNLVPAEQEHLVFAGLLITYEQGLRFLTDHLDGDVYFHTDRPGHNLARCRNQFALVEALERRLPELRAIVARA